jgi:hypothetical protein
VIPDAAACAEGLLCYALQADAEVGTCLASCALEPGELASSTSCEIIGDNGMCDRLYGYSWGLCTDRCDPYPADPDAAGGCEGGASCVQRERAKPGEPIAAGCFVAPGTLRDGQVCESNSGAINGGCDASLICTLDRTVANTVCRRPCDPHGDPGYCGDGLVCGGVTGLFTEGRGACMESANPVPLGAPCTNPLAPCDDHGSICMPMPDGSYECARICRRGVASDCPSGMLCKSVLKPVLYYDPDAGVCVR